MKEDTKKSEPKQEKERSYGLGWFVFDVFTFVLLIFDW